LIRLELSPDYDRGVSPNRRPIGDTDLAAVGTLLAEPARAKVLLALADGRSLAASVLAVEAGVTPSTASHHLARLVDAGLITEVARGRYKYFTLAGPQVGELLEAVARVAPTQPVRSLRQGTRAYAVRYARRCYDHLAGRLGVAVTDALRTQGLVAEHNGNVGYTLTHEGAARLAQLGVGVQPGDSVRRCLDWDRATRPDRWTARKIAPDPSARSRLARPGFHHPCCSPHRRRPDAASQAPRRPTARLAISSSAPRKRGIVEQGFSMSSEGGL
jgi:DNA-binding transcriptional ArsR family regulator